MHLTVFFTFYLFVSYNHETTSNEKTQTFSYVSGMGDVTGTVVVFSFTTGNESVDIINVRTNHYLPSPDVVNQGGLRVNWLLPL